MDRLGKLGTVGEGMRCRSRKFNLFLSGGALSYLSLSSIFFFFFLNFDEACRILLLAFYARGSRWLLSL